MTTYRIYALVDPLTTQVHYVGKTLIGLKARLMGHIYSGTVPMKQWVLSLSSKGLRPEIVELESLSFEKYYPSMQMLEMEHFWVNYFHFIGADLKNQQLLKGRHCPNKIGKVSTKGEV